MIEIGRWRFPESDLRLASTYRLPRRPGVIALRQLLAVDQLLPDRRGQRPGTVTGGHSGEELADGGAFVRRIVLGPFPVTNEVDYCDPSGHHGD